MSDRIQELEAKLDRALFLAEHLLCMIPQEVWREQGAEHYGQYEGDYWAEQTGDEIVELQSWLAATRSS